MNSDLWVGAATTLAGAVLGGAISFLLSRQQMKYVREQRAEEALNEERRRGLDRRFSAYTDFHMRVRAFRNVVHPSRSESQLQTTVNEINTLAQSAQAASSLVFLVLENTDTRDACRAVARAIRNIVTVIHEADSDLQNVPWEEMNDNLARAARQFEAAARAELHVEIRE